MRRAHQRQWKAFTATENRRRSPAAPSVDPCPRRNDGMTGRTRIPPNVTPTKVGVHANIHALDHDETDHRAT
jgi:hypothetical protein